MKDWSFLDAENTAVFTAASITSGDHPVLYVSHDLDDGAWQFQSGRNLDDNEPKVVALRRVVEIDPSVSPLSDLPLGWAAVRKSAETPWQRFSLPDT